MLNLNPSVVVMLKLSNTVKWPQEYVLSGMSKRGAAYNKLTVRQ